MHSTPNVYDVPIESVSKMLGHKSIKITQHYAKIMDKKVSADMRVLAEKLCRVGMNCRLMPCVSIEPYSGFFALRSV